MNFGEHTIERLAHLRWAAHVRIREIELEYLALRNQLKDLQAENKMLGDRYDLLTEIQSEKQGIRGEKSTITNGVRAIMSHRLKHNLTDDESRNKMLDLLAEIDSREDKEPTIADQNAFAKIQEDAYQALVATNKEREAKK